MLQKVYFDNLRILIIFCSKMEMPPSLGDESVNFCLLVPKKKIPNFPMISDDDGNVSFVNMGFGQLVCTTGGSSLVRGSGRTAKWRQSAQIFPPHHHHHLSVISLLILIFRLQVMLETCCKFVSYTYSQLIFIKLTLKWLRACVPPF